MGHTRLGSIPKSKKWKAVVAQFTEVPGVAVAIEETALPDLISRIADQTLSAASSALTKAGADPGLNYAFFLLSQVALAARTDDWSGNLTKFGIRLSSDATIFDLTAEFQASVDEFVRRNGHSTDLSEMAQKAAGEALTSLAASESSTLFGSGREELQSAIRKLSTKAGFGALGQRFFGRFMSSFLNFYLSRLTATHVGGQLLAQVGDVSRFNEVLRAHCDQSAQIVREFCAGWYSKAEYQTGIDLDNTSRFIAVALQKLSHELQMQRREQ